MRTLLLILVSTTSLASARMTREWKRWEPNWEFDGVMSQFRGGVGGFLWYPVLQDERTIAFSQLGTGWIRNAYFANYGMGVRRFITSDVVVGANAFVDISYSDHEVSYYQGGFGLELLGPCWELQANSYFPKIKQTAIREDTNRDQAFLVPDPGGVAMDIFARDLRVTAVECSFYGYDALAGYMFDIGPGELWGRVGYYYYRTRRGNSFQGPRLIAEYISKPLVGWGAQVFFGVSWEHDNLNRGQAGAHVGFRIPFCWYSRTRNWCKSSICRRAAYAVRRQSSVRIEREQRRRRADPEFLANAFFVQQGGVGTGTQDNPTNLAAALAAAAPGDMIFLLNSGGNIVLPAGGIDLAAGGLNNAIVAGFGANGAVANVPIQGRTLTVTALLGQQGRPTLTGAGINAVTLASNNLLQGFGVNTAASAAVGTATSGATIDDVVGSTLTASGLLFTNMTGTVNVANSTFSTVTGNGVEVVNSLAGISGTTKVQNTTFNTVTNGLVATVTGTGASTNVLFSNNTIATTTARGIDVTVTSAAGGTTRVNLIANSNTISATTTEPINIATTFVNPLDTHNLQISGNTIVSPPGAVIAVNVLHSGTGGVNATVTDNRESGNLTATSAYTIQRGGAGAGTLCTDFTGNTTGRPAGVTLDATPATLQVEQLPSVSALNNGMTVATVGTPANVPAGTCPEPEIP